MNNIFSRFLLIAVLLYLPLNAKTQFEKDKEMAIYFDTMAVTYKELGNLEKAKEYHLKELKITKKLYPNHIRLGTSYINFSSLLQEMGELSLAKEYALNGLKIYEKQESDKNSTRFYTVYINLGIILNKLKQYPQAKAYLIKALSNLKEENNYFNIAINNYQLALVEVELNNLNNAKLYAKKAIKKFEEVEKILKEFKYKRRTNPTSKDLDKLVKYKLELQKRGLHIGLPVTVSLGHARNLLAKLETKPSKKSINMIKKSIKSSSAIIGEQHPELAKQYNELALLYLKQKKFQEAKKTMEKAVYIGKEKLNKNSLLLMTYFHNYSLILFHIFNEGLSNDLSKPFMFEKMSFKIFKRNSYENFIGLTEEEQLIYNNSNNKEKIENWIKLSYIFMKHLNKLQNNSELKEKIKEFEAKKFEVLNIITTDWLNYKGHISNNTNLLSNIYNSTKNKALKQNIHQFRNLTNKLSTLYKKPYLTQKDKQQNKEQITKIKTKKSQVEISINKDSKKFRERIRAIDKIDISSQLKENQVYLDFMMVQDRYFILILKKDGSTGLISMLKQDTDNLHSYIQQFKKNIQTTQDSINANKPIKTKLAKKSQEILSNIYDIVFKKYFTPIIKNENHLIISPDGLLNFLPFEALYHNGRYLIEDYKISYISSGREFVRQARREQKNSNNKVVVFGSPTFEFGIDNDEDNIKSVTSSFNSAEYDTLDSRKEINIIKKSYDNVKVYEKENATVENLMKIKNPKILHISTHGFFFDDESIANPMMRTGLAFTSANRASYEDNFSGLVTALKLSSMELYGTELVVLSACETGLGKIHNAEGVAGLPKAFIQAGAKKVMMSLWKVSEDKTAILMENFYKHVAKGEDYATALRSAKLQMLEEHPFYWSAFVMSGV